MPNRTKVEKMISKFGGKLTTLLAGLLAAALIIYSGYVLYDTFYIQKNAGSSWELVELKAQVMEDIDDGTSPTAGSLAEINKDFRAWLTIYDTNIDYPVMQGENDLYYSSHDINQKSSLTGSIYLAARSSSDFSDNYNIVYGHHMDHKILFGGLDSLKDQDYFASHKSGMLIAGNVIYDLEMFAVITTDAYEEAVYTVGNRDLTSLIAFIKDHAVQFDEEAANASKIIAFSTCESTETNGRLVVFAKMVQRGSEEEKPQGNPVITENGNTPDPTGTPEDGTTLGGGKTDVTVIEDAASPLANMVNKFQPTGGSYGNRAWALINLVCVILTLYLLFPLARIKGKINRVKTMRKINELEEDKNSTEASDAGKWIKRFRTRLVTGFALESIIAIGAVIIFLLTENMHLPMVLIDKWTPFMLLILLMSWITDLFLVRNRTKEQTQN